jgi:putative transposase
MKNKALKMRFYPTDEQKIQFANTFGCVRFVYNHILKQRTDLYYNDGVSVGYNESSKLLTELKKDSEFSWLSDVSSVPLQQCLRNQQSAFKSFFEKRANYPNFKSKRDRQSAKYMSSAFSWDGSNLKLAKQSEPLDIRWSYEKPLGVKSLTVSKDFVGRYFVSLLIEFGPDSLPESDKSIGVDLGVKDLVVCSDGFKSGNLKLTKRYSQRLAYLQRKLSKKKKGSSNRTKARIKVAKVHAKIRDTRLDNIHKLTRKLVNENQVIAVEDLSVSSMLKDKRVSKVVSDAGMYEFVRQLEYKSDWGGRTFVKIDRYYPSSKRCSSCGYILRKLSLSTRVWECPECHEKHDRDVNASRNILAAGHAVIASGATGAGV